jgi:hypothetical protein
MAHQNQALAIHMAAEHMKPPTRNTLPHTENTKITVVYSSKSQGSIWGCPD